jgi:hypothetical protein
VSETVEIRAIRVNVMTLKDEPKRARSRTSRAALRGRTRRKDATDQKQCELAKDEEHVCVWSKRWLIESESVREADPSREEGLGRSTEDQTVLHLA